MLDNDQVIAQRDPQDALGYAKTIPEQLGYQYDLKRQENTDTISSLVFAGMGGSAIAAEYLKTYPSLKVPFIVTKGYSVPDFVDSSTLVICASFSGNTEETLASLDDAAQKGARIVSLSNGGKLAEEATSRNIMHVAIPDCPQPRMATFYAYRATCEVLVAFGLAEASVLDELNGLVEPLNERVASWLPGVPTEQNLAKQLAHKIAGKTPIIYAGPLMSPAAYKWKISMNENAKNTAWINALPEFNHNEFMGWTSHPVEKPFAVIDLISNLEHERVQKRFEVTDRLLSGMRPKSSMVVAEGSSVLQHMLYLVLLGDFTSTYLAILNGVNPTPVELIEKFKKELG